MTAHRSSPAARHYRIRLRHMHMRDQMDHCIYCMRRFGDDRPATLEHIVPVSRGGHDTIENTCASCSECNLERGTMNHRTFLWKKRHQLAHASRLSDSDAVGQSDGALAPRS